MDGGGIQLECVCARVDVGSGVHKQGAAHVAMPTVPLECSTCAVVS